MPGYAQWMEGKGIKPADLRPYSMATNSVIGQLMDEPGNRDLKGLSDELLIRQNVNDVANAAQLAEVGYNFGETAIDIGSKFAPNKLGGIAQRLNRANPYVNLATNLTQGAFTYGSGRDVYGTGDKVGAEVIALDLADSAPAVAAASFSGPFAPVTTPVAQTLFGGAASAAVMKHYSEKERPILLNNPPQTSLFHRENRDHGRNQVNQIWTGVLNQKMQEKQDAFDRRYAMHLNPKYADQDQEVLANLRRRHGQLVADYDDAMNDQNWIQKSYYAIRQMLGDDAAFDDFLSKSKGSREQREKTERDEAAILEAERTFNPYAPRSRRALEATRYQSF